MNPAKNPIETWEEGVELGAAWFEFASDYEKNQYRNARDKNQAEYLRILMKAGLIAKIRDGKLVSSGLRVAPNLSEAREKIPAFLFTDLGQSDVILKDIDWKRSTLRSAGREYVQVRVYQPSGEEPQMPRLEKAAPIVEPDGRSHRKTPPTPSEARRPGRPSRLQDVERVIDAVIADGIDLATLPRKDAYEQIRQKGRELGISVGLGFSVSVMQRALVARFGPRCT